MIGHIVCKTLDKRYPASLSYKITTELLRNKMGFKGVIFTDDLCMGAIEKHYDLGEAAIMAVLAGVDVVLVCKNIAAQKKVKKALNRAVRSGKIPEKRLDESVNRVLKLKKGLRDN